MALFVASNAHAAALPDDCAQLIVALAPDWNSVHGRLYLLEKAGGKWRAQAGPVPVLFGKMPAGARRSGSGFGKNDSAWPAIPVHQARPLFPKSTRSCHTWPRHLA